MQKRYFTADDQRIWVNLAVSLVRDADRQPLHFISQLQDITEQKRLQWSLQHLADHDPLTGLWNRRRFEEELQRQIGRCQRYREQAAVLILDLDGFKKVNDTHGHAAGDQLLNAVATALARRLRDTDSLCRLGGDEFAVILAGASPDQSVQVIVSLRKQVRQTQITVGDTPVAVSVCIGVALLDKRATTAADALHQADTAMYQAKSAPAAADSA